MNSEQLAKTDLKDLLPKCLDHKTTTKKDYVNHMHDGRIYRPDKIQRVQMDPALISGHYANNLKVNNVEMKTRTWPYAMDWREEYHQFLLRTKWCNENIYNLFFVCPPVRFDLVEDFLRDLKRTVYGSDYSPNEYVSLVNKKDVLHKLDDLDAGNSKDYQTTYGNSYNRLEELRQLRPMYFQKPTPKNLSLKSFEQSMRKIFRKYELSTYFDEVCLPALVTAKQGKMPTGPIDRYTLRRY